MRSRRNKVVGKNKRPGSNKATGRDYSYDKAYQSSPKEKKRRAARNAARKSLGLKKGDPRDAAHTKNGVVAKHKSVNRGSKTDMPGDKRARGGKKKDLTKPLSDDNIEHIREYTGDKNMSKSSIEKGKWFLPTELTIGVQKYLEAAGKM